MNGISAPTAAALLSLLRQVGGAAGEVALQRAVTVLLSLRAWQSNVIYVEGRVPATGLPDPAVTRVAVCCLAAACAAVQAELGAAAMAGGCAGLPCGRGGW